MEYRIKASPVLKTLRKYTFNSQSNFKTKILKVGLNMRKPDFSSNKSMLLNF